MDFFLGNLYNKLNTVRGEVYVMPEQQLPEVTAIVVAAGASRRMGFDKLSYRLPDGQTVLEKSCAALTANPAVTQLVLVCGANRALCEQIAACCAKPCTVVDGGATRADSVRNGLAAAQGELVAIHDAARPFVSQQIITETLQMAARTGAAAPAVPVKDTIKVVRTDRTVDYTPDRASLYAVQTPQCFSRALYEKALAGLNEDTASRVTDDCSLFELAGMPVTLTAGSYENYKITTKDDLQKEKTMRIGHGYDVHQLVEGRKLILGGVEIPYEKGLLGHSDADVLLHAIMDAVLGAAALGDIGKHFPDTDPAYKGADSLALTRAVAGLVREQGYSVGNIDSTILCQAPKLAPHIPAMRAHIAEAFGIPLDAVSVKATTEEHMGFTGEGRGIAAHAVVLLEN
ncbi:2-C-methyl-D-erythritol 2,4-cyclodiphosphate synthase [Subdoligranulum variabile DSM 15176]|uniref:Bifunctional enzyme IspD/IspF n=2 Tax=Subdoligranulum variabile TaxID=214851 RepID=D1PLD9_9FIRM|nr:2-C-methyl-D-erythritol 2,4-cyclodiphosphate synthase [Subdoligranulum variabile DSM 15176]